VACRRTALPGLLTQYFDFHLSLIIPQTIRNNKADSVPLFEKQNTMALVQSYVPVLKKKSMNNHFWIENCGYVKTSFASVQPKL
jgi:hypothetical protein